MIDRRHAILNAPWLALGLALCGCQAAADKPDEAVVTVQAAKPVIGPLSEEISADAVLAPLAQAAIAPRISAPILHEYVQRGQHVKQGQLLLTLEAADLTGAALDSKGAYTAAQAAYSTAVDATIPEEVKKAETDVAQARAAREVASRTAEERKKLFEQGALSGRDADTAYAAAAQAQAAYEVAVQHLESVTATTRKTSQQAAEGQLASARGKLSSAEAQVSFAQLRSPINGVVTERPLFPGETAQAGTTVVTVMDTSALLAKLHLAQSQAQKLRVGDKARVTVPGVEDPLEGSIAFVGPALDPGSTTVEVWVKVSNADGSLKAGTPVHALLSGPAVKAAVQVPASAIVPGADGGTAVVVASPDGTAHKKAVKIGIRTSNVVQILSGLAPHDDVITDGGYGLDDGAKVKIGAPAGDESDMDGGGRDGKGAATQPPKDKS